MFPFKMQLWQQINTRTDLYEANVCTEKCLLCISNRKFVFYWASQKQKNTKSWVFRICSCECNLCPLWSKWKFYQQIPTKKNLWNRTYLLILWTMLGDIRSIILQYLYALCISNLHWYTVKYITYKSHRKLWFISLSQMIHHMQERLKYVNTFVT